MRGDREIGENHQRVVDTDEGLNSEDLDFNDADEEMILEEEDEDMLFEEEDEDMLFEEEDKEGWELENSESEDDEISLDEDMYDKEPDANYIWGDTPKLGMVFETVDEAYNFYNAYGKFKGFSIRKNNTSLSRKDDKRILMKRLCCSKEGKRRTSLKFNSPKKPRPVTRVGCRAHFVVRWKKEDKKYELTDFVEEHNHSLAKPSEAHMLRSQRGVKEAQGGVIVNMHNAGIGATKIHSYLRSEVGGSQNLNITKDDCTNFVQRHRREVIKDGDAHTVIKYFMQLKKNDPSFFYTYKLDEDDRLASCFWCDARSRIDYSFFSDVLCFDTTYKTNGYDLPYAPFVGVNHHGQSILFGCGLIFNETTESFIWLFEAFLEAMDGKKPMTIFTDQAQAIGNAIRYVFPDSHHRLCLWHIYQNAGKHLAHVYEEFKGFQKNFHDVVYNNETEEEFEAAWSKLIKDYNLEGNTWLNDLYSKKEQWALVYGRQYFCAGITTTQRSESMNSYFKRYLHRKMLLYEFAGKYDVAVLDRREEEISQDLKSRQNVPILKTRWKVEKEASEKYTMKLFSRFQEQLVESWNLFETQVEVEGTMTTYNVSSYGDFGRRSVTFDSSDNTIKCSCKHFEFTGILCSHALKVLHIKQVKSLPPSYYLHRWTKDATSGMVMKSGCVWNESGAEVQVDPNSTLSSRYSKLMHTAVVFAVKSATISESYELGMKELMEGLRKIDICLETHGGKINKNVSEIDEENDTLQEEPTVKVKDPPRKKNKDASYSRCKGALEKSKKSAAKVQKNPRKRQANNQKKNEGGPPMGSEILSSSTTSSQVAQQLFPLTSQVASLQSPQLANFGTMSVKAPQVHPQSLGVEGVYNPHIRVSQSMSMMHLRDPTALITQNCGQVITQNYEVQNARNTQYADFRNVSTAAQQSTPRHFRVRSVQNAPNVIYRHIATDTLNHQNVGEVMTQYYQVRGACNQYTAGYGNMNVLPSQTQGSYNHFYGDSSHNPNFTSQDSLVVMSRPLLQQTNTVKDMESNQSLLSLLREDGRTKKM